MEPTEPSCHFWFEVRLQSYSSQKRYATRPLMLTSVSQVIEIKEAQMRGSQ